MTVHMGEGACGFGNLLSHIFWFQMAQKYFLQKSWRIIRGSWISHEKHNFQRKILRKNMEKVF